MITPMSGWPLTRAICSGLDADSVEPGPLGDLGREDIVNPHDPDGAVRFQERLEVGDLHRSNRLRSVRHADLLAGAAGLVHRLDHGERRTAVRGARLRLGPRTGCIG